MDTTSILFFLICIPYSEIWTNISEYGIFLNAEMKQHIYRGPQLDAHHIKKKKRS